MFNKRSLGSLLIFVFVLTLAVQAFPGKALAWIKHGGISHHFGAKTGIQDMNNDWQGKLFHQASWADNDSKADRWWGDWAWGKYHEYNEDIQKNREQWEKDLCNMLDFAGSDCDHFYNAKGNSGDGEADKNAREFVLKAQNYKESGSPDLAMRSLARGFHYIQDLSQPYHAQYNLNTGRNTGRHNYNSVSCGKWLKHDHKEYASWHVDNFTDGYFSFAWHVKQGVEDAAEWEESEYDYIQNWWDVDNAVRDMADKANARAPSVDCWQDSEADQTTDKMMEETGAYMYRIGKVVFPNEINWSY
ncbi:MAG: hypothetical protein ABEK50_07955 [bacterium]